MPKLRLRHSANLSHNRIAEWTQFYDVYDPTGALVGSESREHRNVSGLRRHARRRKRSRRLLRVVHGSARDRAFPGTASEGRG